MSSELLFLDEKNGEKMDNKTVLDKALEFHGHRCWASVAGVRVGLAALAKLGVKRSGGTQLFGIVEIGDEHGGMCFGDGVQYSPAALLVREISARILLASLASP